MDSRALNAITRTYVQLMSRGKDIFAKLENAKFFTMLDLRSGHHCIALYDDAIKKTAFVTPLGKYDYLIMTYYLNLETSFHQFTTWLPQV